MDTGDRERVHLTPWFRVHPEAATLVAAALFLAVLVSQLFDARAADAIALLYVLPIALGAVTFGLAGGLLSAVAGYAFFAVFSVASSTGHVAVEGWISRGVAMFLLGGLLGRASDQTERATQLALQAQLERLELEERHRRYCEGLELSDSILQQVAVAKWQLEQGNEQMAAELLTVALESGEHMVGELLPARSATNSS